MKNYDVETLRAELNEYSPEQQKEKDDAAFKEALKTFSELVVEMEQCGSDMAKMVALMRDFPIKASKACELRVTQQTRMDYAQVVENAVHDASSQLSKMFDEKVAVVNQCFEQRLSQLKKEEHRVSLPVYSAYSLYLPLVVMSTTVGIFIYINYTVCHNEQLWVVTWAMIAVLLWVLGLLAYCGYRKWL